MVVQMAARSAVYWAVCWAVVLADWKVEHLAARWVECWAELLAAWLAASKVHLMAVR